MKRKVRISAYILTLFILLCSFFGCAVTEDGDDTKPSRKHDVLPIASASSEPTASPQRTPLMLISKSTTVDGCTVNYPFVCDSELELLNVAILAAFSELASYCESPGSSITYTTQFNRNGLLSFLLTCSSADGRELAVDAANFDCISCRRVFLSACFGSSPDYAAKLSELVSREVAAAGASVLSSPPPMDDSRPFYFTFGGLCLVYRDLELTSRDPAVLRVSAPLEELAGVIAPDGLLNRLK
ncbi:MAG: hypothetical protein IKG85_09810 [Clostridia bacterium]|nr:hypothetical protein [Clostridia bacterium]